MNLLEALKVLGIELSEEQKVKANELNENYIPHSRFNEVNEKYKESQKLITERDEQIKNLGANQSANEELKKQIEELTLKNQTQATEFENKYKEINRKNQFKSVVAKYGVKDKFLQSVEGMIDNTKLVENEDGSINGFDEQLTKILEDYPEYKDESKNLGNVGNGTTDNGSSTQAELEKVNKYRLAMGLKPKTNL